MKELDFIRNKMNDVIIKKNIKPDFITKKIGVDINRINKKGKMNSCEFITLCLFLKLNLQDFIK